MLQITKPRCQFKRNLQHVFQTGRYQFEDLTGVCGDVKTLRYVSAQCRLGRCLSLCTEVPHCIGCVVFLNCSSCHGCGQCTSVLKLCVQFFTRLVVNSSTEFNWNAHRGTAKPGFSRDWLSARNLFAKLTSFHPHQCAHRMQLVLSVRQRTSAIVAQPTPQILPEI